MLFKYNHPEMFCDEKEPDYETHNGKIIIYGAGINGALILALLKKRGIEITCFADSDMRKVGSIFHGYMVISRVELVNKYRDYVIIISPYIQGALFKDLSADGCKNLYDCAPLFLEFDTDDISSYIPEKVDVFHCVQTFLNRRSYANHALTVVVTERCTLKCRECMAFIPYIKNPIDYNFDKLCETLDHILPTGEFPDIYLEGGEALLHNNFIEIVQKLLSFPEVHHIWLITNGTIMPSEEILQVLRNERIIIWISDYGNHSSKMTDLKRVLSQNAIANHSTVQHWYQVTKAFSYRRSAQEDQQIFVDCCKGLQGMNPFLINGRIYRCQFHARSEELGIIPFIAADSVDVYSEPEKLKQDLQTFFIRKNYMDACKYCCGRGYSSIEVPVAEQIVGELAPLPRINKDII
jgi:hypothetical protein